MFTDAYSRRIPGQAVQTEVGDSAHISWECDEGKSLTTIKSPGVTELHLTITPLPKESPTAIARRLAKIIKAHDATIVRQIAFGPLAASASTLAALQQTLNTPEVPLLWVEGVPCVDIAIAGIQVQAIAQTKVRTLSFDGKVSARLWHDAVMRHCVLSNLGAPLPNHSPAEQTREAFIALQGTLAQAGMTMKDVARTWFFLDDILSWYDEFNRVRNAVFEQHELRPNSLPASTGVRGRNPAGSALTAAAWAVQPRRASEARVTYVASPRQCTATAYGSAFSRAAEIHSGGYRQLLISGTASIAPNGKTAHVGDPVAQIGLTMKVVGDLLQSRGMSFRDVTRATAYFKTGTDLPLFRQWLSDRQLTAFPVVNTCCEICREDLLFEIEVDAVKAAN